MVKRKTLFVCQNCGAEFPKWQGRCFECGAWNLLVETVVSLNSKSKIKKQSVAGGSKMAGVVLESLDKVEMRTVGRFSTGFSEFDRVLGGPSVSSGQGGIVPGSVILLAGEPGIGKSTLLLQVAASAITLYVSGEESVEQLKLRAERIGLDSKKILVLAETDVDVISEVVSQLISSQPASPAGRQEGVKQRSWPAVKLIIIDSVQTLETSDLTSPPGCLSQVQECARRLAKLAKALQIP